MTGRLKNLISGATKPLQKEKIRIKCDKSGWSVLGEDGLTAFTCPNLDELEESLGCSLPQLLEAKKPKSISLNKAALIRLMKKYVVVVHFRKVTTGEMRTMHCTLHDDVISWYFAVRATGGYIRAKKPGLVIVWDMEKDWWRSFYVGTVKWVDVFDLYEPEKFYRKFGQTDALVKAERDTWGPRWKLIHRNGVHETIPDSEFNARYMKTPARALAK